MHSYSQNQCPPNIDFEYGNTSFWSISNADVSVGPAGLLPAMTAGVAGPVPGGVSHTLINAASLPVNDPIGGFPVLNPLVGTSLYSYKLNDDLLNDGGGTNNAALMDYTYSVPAFNQNLTILLYYAVVLNDGSHLINEQPHFRIEVTDLTAGNSIIPCASPDFFPQASVGWVTTPGGNVYISWKPLSVNLKGLAGHNIKIRFIAHDCVYGGHWGYAYFDLSSICSSNPVTPAFCPGDSTATFLAPVGFASYTWYDNNFTVLSTNDSLFLTPPPTAADTFYCAYFPIVGQGCADTIQIPVNPAIPAAGFSFPNNFCPGVPIQFTDTSIANPGTAVNGWHWFFGDPTVTNDTSNIANPFYTFPYQDSFIVGQYVLNNFGCPSDTFYRTLTFNTLILADTLTTCPNFPYTGMSASATGPIPLVPIPCGTNSSNCVSTTNYQIGSGTNTTATVTPFNGGMNNGRMLMRYTKSDLNAIGIMQNGTITSLAYEVVVKNSFLSLFNLTIKMSCYPTGAAMPTNFVGGSVVFGPTNYNTVMGWNTFNLTNTFDWDGNSDLMIEICFSGPPSASDAVRKSILPVTSQQVLYASNFGGGAPSGCAMSAAAPNTFATSNLLPNLKLDMCGLAVNNSNYNFLWWSTPAMPINPQVSSNPTIVPSGPGTIHVKLLGAEGCIVEDSFLLLMSAPFTINPMNDSSLCFGGSTSLFPVIPAGLPSPSFQWWSQNPTTAFSSTTTSNCIVTITATDTIYFAIDAQGCTVVDTIILFLRTTPTADFTVTTPVCIGGNSTLTYTGTGTISSVFNWNFGTGTAVPGGNVANHTESWTTSGLKKIILTVTDSGCVSVPDTQMVTVLVQPIAQINSNTVLPVCEGLPINVNSVGSFINNPANAILYLWNFGIANSVTPPSSNTNPGPYTVTYTNPLPDYVNDIITLQISENGCLSNIDSLPIVSLPIPVANFTMTFPNPNNQLCTGQQVVLTNNSTTNSNGLTPIYSWLSNGGNPINSASNTTFTITYYNNSNPPVAQVTTLPQLTVTQEGCSNNSSQAVNTNALPTPTIIGLLDVCANSTNALAVVPNFVGYLWSNLSTNDSIFVTGGGFYSVLVTDPNYCQDTAQFTIIPHLTPIANAGPDFEIFRGNSVRLDGTQSVGGNSFTWSPADYIDDKYIAQPTVTPPTTTAFILTYYSSAYGCSDWDTVVVKIKDCEPLALPNAFTPNNDGIDDYFMILNPNDYYRLVSMEIYNRWGQKIFITNNKDTKGWDGKMDGVPQEVGTYIYSITANCDGNKTIQLKGDITLIR